MDKQHGREQGKDERHQIGDDDIVLAAQDGDHLIQKIDARNDATRYNHDSGCFSELGKVNTVQEAEYGQANPVHQEHHDKSERGNAQKRGDDDQVEAAALFGVVPRLRHFYEHRLVDGLPCEQDKHGGEVQNVVVELVVVAKHAFHYEFRHIVDERIHEQRGEQGPALLEQAKHGSESRARRLLGFEVGKRYGQEERGCAGEHRHDNACRGKRTCDKQRDGERDEGEQCAHENAHAAQVHFSDLL